MKAAIMATLAFLVLGGTAAQAATTLLTGSIQLMNPAATWKAPQTVNYNAIYATAETCELAKTAAINSPIQVFPAAATGGFGTFYKIVLLNCDTK